MGRFCDAFYIIGGNPKPSPEIGGYKFEEIKKSLRDENNPAASQSNI